MATDPREAILSAGDAEASGMPQLDPGSYPNQIFWLLLALIAIYFVLARVALPRIGSVLAERQGTITNDIAAAEELKLKASEAEKSYEKSLADARAEAQRIAAETHAEIQAETDRKMEEADAKIAEQQGESERRITEIRDQALSHVETVAKDTARALVDALGGETGDGKVDQTVDRKLEERA